MLLRDKILILEDDPDASRKLAVIIQDRRYEAVFAPDAHAAEELIRDEPFDLFMANPMLAGPAGVGWLERVREIQSDLSILLLVTREELHKAVLFVKLGAQGFLNKPLSVPSLQRSVETALGKSRAIREKVSHRLSEALEAAQFDAIKALAQAIEEKDHYTGGHCERMVAYAEAMAKELALSEDATKTLRYVALLHDVGKIGIPEGILNKAGRLSEEEFAVMKTHPEKGAEIVRRISSLAPVADLIYCHQERYDGLGYPAGLAGREIPLEARIVAVLDAFDAMTSDRPYRKSLPTETAVQELRRYSNIQFDPDIVEVFANLVQRAS